jgi:isoamylase
VRDFWRGEPATLGEFASRLTGSSDLYEDDGRRPIASINFVTAHDGFTLRDLASYNTKHNEANLDANRDGESYNRSWNCGHEGEGASTAVELLRAQQQRNFIATMFLSQGVPMLLAGDEMGRTQHGNNNGYCQDNEISWLDWSLLETNADQVEFIRAVTRLRREHPVFRRRRFFHGTPIRGTHDALSDITWFAPNGEEMTDADWETGFAKSVGVFLNGDAISEPDRRGGQITDDSFLMLFNAHHDPLAFVMPNGDFGKEWEVALDTAQRITARPGTTAVRAGVKVEIPARSVLVLKRTR